jgi:excisionase family DNA binding protein
MSKLKEFTGASEDAKPRLLSIVGASQELGICRTLVYTLIKEGKLRSITIGRRRLVPAEAIDELIANLNRGGKR